MLTVRQTAERLSLSLSMTYRLIDGGEIEHHRFGRAIRVSESQLAAFLKRSEKAKSERDAGQKRQTRPRLRDLEI